MPVPPVDVEKASDIYVQFIVITLQITQLWIQNGLFVSLAE